jgi:hypothetical protein
VPTICPAKVNVAGETLATGAPTAVPEALTCCGLFAALSVIRIVVESGAVDCGVNSTPKKQLVFGGTLTLFEATHEGEAPAPGATIRKSTASVEATPVIVSVSVPVFCTWTFCVALVVPTP